jgi:hypothetical protein
MSSFQRSNLYASEELGGTMDKMDMSGFLGSPPPVQPQERARQARVTERPRQNPTSNPTSNASGVNQPNMGYTVNNPIPALSDEFEDPKFYHALSPFWADENSLGSPKLPAISKVAGVTIVTLAGMYALGTRKTGGSPYAKALCLAGTAMYVHPMLGVNHGLLQVIPGDDHWIAKYPRYGAIGMVHLGGAYGFQKAIRGQF